MELYLLDGYSLVYRSYFAFMRNPRISPRNKNASVVFGFFRSLFAILNDRSPSHFAVVLDSTVPTFRHKKYAEYKATREKSPDDLRDQIPVVEEILCQLNIPAIRCQGYEADDVMATLATCCSERDVRCYVISGDKDLLQLVDGSVVVLKPESGGGFTELDAAGVEEAWGVRPDQILDYLSLVGDSSDNVPGVKGIGAKTAAALLSEFQTLDGIYNHLDQVKSKSQQAKLEDGKEDAYLSRELITLATDAPVERSLEELALPRLTLERAIPFFEAEGMRTIVSDLRSELTEAAGDAEPVDDPELTARIEAAAERRLVSSSGDEVAPEIGGDPQPSLDPSGAMKDPGDAVRGGAASRSARKDVGSSRAAARSAPEPPVYTPRPEDGAAGSYELVESLESLDRWCDRVRAAGRCAFDSETTSVDAMVAQPVGFSLSVGQQTACYIPLHGPAGPMLPAGEVRARLRSLLEDPSIRVIGQNLKYDYKVLSRWGVEIATPYFDTMIAAWLLDTEANSVGMDTLATQYLGYTTVHYDDVVPKTARGEEPHTFDEVPLDRATEYAAEDADVTFRLFGVLSALLAERGLEQLFFELEMPLLPVLAKMELAGITLDAGALAAYSRELSGELHRIEAEIYRLVGHEFNIGSTKQLQEVLFVERKLTAGKKTKTGYSTDISVLQELAQEDPVPGLVLRHRMLSKLQGTYVDALPKMINSTTGRLHTHFNMTGTATGRLSSADPNLQNIPIRDEEGRRIRSAFVAPPGHVFVSADYSQIELVVLAHLSGDPGLLAAFRDGVDVHRHTGSLIFGVATDQVTSEQRRIAKTINFGVMYGMSAFRLSRELQIPRKDADAFIEAYFTTYSRIKGFIEETVAEAERTGYVETICGRRRYLRNITNRNRTVKMGAERIAVNTPIQGSAADIMKRAMLAVHADLGTRGLQSRMLLQVHDELILECPDGEAEQVAAMLRAVMPAAIELSLPLSVSVEQGRTWGDLH